MKNFLICLILINSSLIVTAQAKTKSNSVYKKPLDVKDLVAEEILPAEWQVLPIHFSLRNYCPTPMAQVGGVCAAASTTYAARSISWNINHNITDSATKDKMAFDPYMVYDLISNENKDDSIRNEGAALPDALSFLKVEGCFPNHQYDSLFKIAYDDLSKYLQNFTISDFQDILFYDESKNNYSDTTKWNIKNKNIELKFEALGFISAKERTLGTIKFYLMNGNPVIFGASTGKNFTTLNAENPCWDDQKKFDSLNYTSFHGMTIIGWNDSLYGGSFEVMNSHGTEFGKDGFFWVTYTQFLTHTFEAYSILDFGPENERYFAYYPNGNIKMHGEISNRKKCGVWTSYYPDGLIRSEIEYRDGWRHGPAKVYASNGVILTEVNYNRGKLNGELIVRNANGTVIKTGTFVMGKGDVIIMNKSYSCNGKEHFGFAEGKWIFKEKNKIVFEGTYSKGYKNGVFNLFDQKTNQIVYTNYFSYNVLSAIKEYFPNGSPRISLDLKDGKMHGTRKIYDEKGKVLQASIYKNNLWVEDYYKWVK